MKQLKQNCSDRFIRKGNKLYRPGYIEKSKKSKLDTSWFIAFYIISETSKSLQCNFFPHTSKPSINISKALLV